MVLVQNRTQLLVGYLVDTLDFEEDEAVVESSKESNEGSEGIDMSVKTVLHCSCVLDDLSATDLVKVRRGKTRS